MFSYFLNLLFYLGIVVQLKTNWKEIKYKNNQLSEQGVELSILMYIIIYPHRFMPALSEKSCV